ncbi:hypothetical protein BS17DRAFT_704029 [Gyrodon lividus]|nr:hypothetical protein BS17DRAFT_704029 [Gyrodon lividus]
MKKIICILNLGYKIVAMLQHIWGEIGLPIYLDHTMTMSSTNTNMDVTLGILENLCLKFGGWEVSIQVQVL